MPHQLHQHSDSGYGSSKDVSMARQGSNSAHSLYPHNGDLYNHRMSAQFSWEYRDTRSSVSGMESVAEAFNRPMDLSQDDVIDPRLGGPSDPAGLAGDSYLPFVGQFEDQVSMDHITQSSPIQGLRGADTTLNLPPQDAIGSIPWNSFHLHPTMQSSSPFFPSPNNQRKRPRPDNSNDPSPRSQDHYDYSHYSSSPTGSTQPLLGPAVQHDAFFVRGSRQSEVHPSYFVPPAQSFHQNQQPTTTPAPQRRPSQQGRTPTRGNKQLRNKERKFSCRHCSTTDKGFPTTNDLDRHIRTVHHIIPEGTRVWKCDVSSCTVANKLWPRLDNFKQHVIRMHGPEHGEAAENMCVQFDPKVHDLLELSKSKKPTVSRHSNLQHLPSPSASGTTLNNIDVKGSEYQSLIDSSSAQPDAYLRHTRPSHTNTDRASMTNNPASKGSTARNASYSVSNSSAGPTSQLRYGIPPLPNPSAEGFTLNTPRQRTTIDRHTLANPETHMRQQREMQDQDNSSLYLPLMSPADADIGFMGQVTEDNSHPATVSPNDLSRENGPADAADRIHLASPRPSAASDPFQIFINGLTEEQRLQYYELWGHSSGRPANRSVAKTKSKGKEADAVKAEKTLKCTMKTKVNGKDQLCQKTFDKQSELRKHEKRHAKKFGCTFDHCYKRFGTKWEWKRHEHNQHVQLESWRCRQKSRGSGQRCAQLFQFKKDFKTHICSQHSILDEGAIEAEFRECHLFKKWLGSFWCGFCATIVKSTAPYGPDMDKERNEHVSKHVEGRVGQACDIWNWQELAGKGKTKEQMKEADKRASLKDNDTKMPTPDEGDDEDDEDDDLYEDDEPEQGAGTELDEESSKTRFANDSTPSRAKREPLPHDPRRSSAPTPAFQFKVTTPDTQGYQQFTPPQQLQQYYIQQREQDQQTNNSSYTVGLPYDDDDFLSDFPGSTSLI